MEARPDILLVLGHFGTGGVERVACLLAEGFQERGLASQIFAAHAEGPARALLDLKIPVVSVELGGGSRRAKLKQAIPHIAHYLRRVRPRIFFSPGNHTHVAAGLAHRLARRKDVALVIKITNPIPKASLGTMQRALSRYYYKWLLRRADLILVLSPSGVAQVQGLAGAKAAEKVRFVHNPYIPLDRPASAPIRVGGERLLLAVGRLREQKNYPLLLDALSRIQTVPWRLALLGEGPEEEMLKARARELGIAERVDFLGFMPDPGPYYAAASCLVISSKWEDVPAVALEAMGAGCPVVTTDCSPALSEIVRSIGFGQVTPVEAGALATAIANMISRPSERRVPPEVLAYGIPNGIEEHLQQLRPLLNHGRERPGGTVDPDKVVLSLRSSR
jgi:glycosyltransferase involved in cell wall biosynthesis